MSVIPWLTLFEIALDCLLLVFSVILCVNFVPPWFVFSNATTETQSSHKETQRQPGPQAENCGWGFCGYVQSIS